MDVDVVPEPSPEEREAIALGVERLLEPPDARTTALYESPWRLAGLRENVSGWPRS